jgi:hypothetical protein
VSGTSSAGRGVFFKLKRYSQTSLEGSHELTVTFVAPRVWRWSEIRVDYAARGEQKVLWMKQSGTIGQTTRMVQLVEMSEAGAAGRSQTGCVGSADGQGSAECCQAASGC